MIKAIVNSDRTYEITSGNTDEFEINGKANPFKVLSASEFEWIVQNGNQQYRVLILESNHSEKKYTFRIKGKKFIVKLEDRLDQLLEKMGISGSDNSEVMQVKSPMPGLILEIHGSKGDLVKKGDKILVLEAMKMENVLKSPTDGIILDVLVEVGQSVNKNQLLIQFE